MQFSLEKSLKKRKWIHNCTLVNLSYQSMDCFIKWGNRFMNSTRHFSICLKMFIMQRRKNRAEMRQKELIA